MSNDISTNVVAHKVLEELKNRGFDHFTLRPWNLYKPENTLWWLVPSKDWPSYKYGKIAIYKPKNSDSLRVGFHWRGEYHLKLGKCSHQELQRNFALNLIGFGILL
jgi:hypothetical protein